MLTRCSWELVVLSKDYSYVDYDVLESTEYFYRISAVDFSENSSSFVYPDSSVTTLENLVPPSLPRFIIANPLNSAIQIIWYGSIYSNVKEYKIVFTELNSDLTYNGSSTEVIVGPEFYSYKISDLINNKNYEILFSSISENDVESSEYRLLSSPVQNSVTEVDSVEISDYRSETNINNEIGLEISWDSSLSSSLSEIDHYVYQIIENGMFYSKELTSSITDVVLDNFEDINGRVRYIRHLTDYLVRIYGVDSLGNRSLGFYGYLKTSKYKKPNKAFNFTNNQENGDIIVSWSNDSDINYNLISVSISGTESDFSLSIADNVDIQKSSFYIIPKSLITEDVNVFVSIKTYDSFDNESDMSNYEFEANSVSSSIPFSVDIRYVSNNDGTVGLFWDKVDNAQEYYIWRANWSVRPIPSDFSLIGTLSEDKTYFEDFELENDSRFLYFITYKNIWDERSKDPTDDFISYTMYDAVPHKIELFPNVSSLSIEDNGDAISISWDEYNEYDFDGYLIYSSYDNKYDWEEIGSVSRNTNVFDYDKESFLLSGTHYLKIVPFRNQVDFLFSTNKPNDSLLLGSFSEGSFVPEQNATISDLESLVNYSKEKFLDNHDHLFDNLDKRIDFNKNVYIDNFSEISDFVFESTLNIPISDNYSLKIDGESYLGVFSVDTDTNRITTSSSIEDASKIRLICEGVDEFQGILEEESINDVSPSKIKYGDISKKIEEFDHDGISLKIKPILTNLENKYDGLYFNKNKMISDFIFKVSHIEDNAYLFSNYKGLLLTEDKFVSNRILLENDLPCTGIFVESGSYFAVFYDTVYYSTNYLSWSKTDFEEVGRFRVFDICEFEGDFYCSSSDGYFKLNSDLVWVRQNTISVPNNIYKIFKNGSNIYGCCKNGIYNLITEEIEFYGDFKHKVSNDGYTFLANSKQIVRCNSGNIEKICDSLVGNTEGIAIFDNKIHILSDEDVYCSYSVNNIYFEDISIDFSNSVKRNVFSLGSSSQGLVSIKYKNISIVGSEWSSEDIVYSNNINHYSFYNKEIIKHGFYYSDNYVVLDSDSVVYVGNSSIYSSSGWWGIGIKKQANLYINNKFISSNVDDIGLSNYNLITLSFPQNVYQLKNNTFEDNIISNKFYDNILASSYKDEFDSNYAQISQYIGQTLSSESEIEFSDIFSNLVNNYFNFYSCFYGKILFFSLVEVENVSYCLIEGVLYTIEDIEEKFSDFYFVKNISTDGEGFSCVSGLISVPDGTSPFDNNYLKVLRNFSKIHESIEDDLGKIYTGESLGISDIYTNNLLSTISYFKENVDSDYSFLNLDSVEEQDLVEFESTVGYTEEDSSSLYATEEDSPRILTSSVDFENKIIMGFSSGVYSLDKSDNKIEHVYSDSFVYNIKESGEIFYILSDSGIFSTTDFIDFSEESTDGINGSENIIDIFNISGFLYVVTDYGVYVNIEEEWVKILEDSVVSSCFNNYLVVVTKDGLIKKYINGGWVEVVNNFTFSILDIKKYNSSILIATSDFGLLNDNSSINGSTLSISNVDIAGEIEESKDKSICGICVDGNSIYVTDSDGVFYYYVGGSWSSSNVNMFGIFNIVRADNKTYLMNHSEILIFEDELRMPFINGAIL